MTVAYTDLMEGMAPSGDGGFTATIPQEWMQGRGAYGGLSAALALEGAMRAMPDLPPLRSAQVAFVGPVGGPVRVRTELLRRGRSVAFVNSDVLGEDGAVATRCVFAFGAARPSRFDEHNLPAMNVPPPEECPPFFPDKQGPTFTQFFDARLAAGDPPISGSDKSEVAVWVRHLDAAAAGPVALLAIADMPPPAMLPRFPEFAPISSVTWMVNAIGPATYEPGAWTLIRTAAEDAKDGYSSQDMTLWDATGAPLLAMRQSVAIFI